MTDTNVALEAADKMADALGELIAFIFDGGDPCGEDMWDVKEALAEYREARKA